MRADTMCLQPPGPPSAAQHGPCCHCNPGPVAQWITRLTTDQKIVGSTPAWLACHFIIFFPLPS